MTDWFTIETIDDSTYAISEYGHWERVHSYLLLGSRSALLIDTGLGIGDIRAAVRTLTSLPVQVATTHVHWDHIGGHGRFEHIAVHAADAGWLEQGIPLPLAAIKRDLLHPPLTKSAPPGFDIDTYTVFTGRPTRILHDGDTVLLGDRTVTALHTPGHSPGHLCFWEPQRGYLFTGDLLYAGTLFAFYPSTDPTAYRNSLHKLAALPGIQKLLPAHHRLDLPLDILPRACAAFDEIAQRELLRHGGGTFDYGDFSIKL